MENEFEAVNEEVCYGELPAVEDAFPGKLYLRQADMTLHVLNGAKDGFKQLSAPADALTPAMVSEDLAAEDGKLLASKAAIKAGIQAVADDLADEITNRGTAEAQLLVDAKKYADDQDAALKADLQKEIDDDVKVEKDRAELAEKGLADRLVVIEGEGEGSIKAAVKAEADRAKGEEARIEGLIGTEKTRAEAAELALGERIDALAGDGEGSVADQVGEVKDALEEFKNNVVGAPAVKADPENGVEGQPATGLFKEIADEKAAREAKDAELAKAIEDEVARAKAAEEDNADAIADEASAREAADEALNGRLDVVEAFVAAQPGVDSAQNDRIKALEDANKDGGVMKEAVDAAQAAADAAQADVDAIEKRLDDEGGLVDRLETVEGFVAAHDDTERDARIKALEDDAPIKQAAIEAAQAAADAAQADVDAIEGRLDNEGGLVDRLEAIEESIGDGGDLEERVSANEGKLAGLEKETVQAAIDQAEADAKKYADDAITALVDSAPDAMNTLGELAGAIKAHEDVYKAYVETVTSDIAAAKQEAIDAAAAKDATLKTELQAEIDSDVAAEKALREAEETKIREEFAAADTALHTTISAEIDADVKVEKDRAEAAESRLTQDLAQEVQDRKDAVKGVQDKLDALVGNGEGSVADQIADVKADLEGQLDTFKGEQATKDAAQDKALTDAIAQEVKDRDAAIKVEEDRAKGVEAGFETRIAANEAFVAAQPDIDAEQDRRLEALEAANAEGGAVKEAVDAAKDAADAAQNAADAAQDAADALKDRLDDEGGLVDRLEAAEGFVAAQPAVDEAQDEKIADLEEFVEGHSHEAMEADIKANKEWIAGHSHTAMEKDIADLKALFEGENSVDAKIAAAQAAAEAKAAELDATLKTNLEKYADDAAADAQEAAEATAAADAQAKADQALVDAKAYTDQAEADANTYTDNALTWGSF